MTPDGKLQIGDIVTSDCIQVSTIPFQLLKLDSDGKLQQLESTDINPLKNLPTINFDDPSAPNSIDNIKAAFDSNGLQICNDNFGKRGFPLELWLTLANIFIADLPFTSLGSSGSHDTNIDFNDVNLGNLIVIALSFQAGTSGPPSHIGSGGITDNLGNTYTLIKRHGSVYTGPISGGTIAADIWTELWYTVITTSGHCILTITNTNWGAVASWFAHIMQFICNNPHPLDSSAEGDITLSGTSFSVGPVNVTHSSELVIAAFATRFYPSVIPGFFIISGGSGYNVLRTPNVDAIGMLIEYKARVNTNETAFGVATQIPPNTGLTLQGPAVIASFRL